MIDDEKRAKEGCHVKYIHVHTCAKKKTFKHITVEELVYKFSKI